MNICFLPPGFVDISECIDVALAPDSLRTNEFIVVLRTKEKGQHKGRVFELSAENQITQKDWFNVLDKCIKQVFSCPVLHCIDCTLYSYRGVIRGS